MTMQLCQAIRNDTDNRFFASRFYHSLKTVTKEKGFLYGILMGGSLTAAKMYTLAICYFAMEGTVRSAIETLEYDRPIVSLRPLGDIGGWTDLTLFSILGFGNLFIKLIREGEYLRLKPICIQWLQDNKELIAADPNLHKKLYVKINDLFDAFNTRCLFSKSLLSRRLSVLEILQDSTMGDNHSKYSKDKQLQKIFQDIQSNLDNISSPKQYFNRLYDGHKSIKKGGCCKQSVSLTLGVALPIIFLLTTIFSYVGEFGLGKELFIDKEAQTDKGHFGEWPFNAAEATGAAFILLLWFMINEGIFVRTRKVYARQLNNLQDNPPLHNRLCNLANEDLSQIAKSCNYFKLPLEYQFEKL